jgi:hypothetical protein
MLKMLVQVQRRPGMTDEVFYDRWEREHGDLVRRHAEAIGFKRYVQTHRRPSAEIEAFARDRGWGTPPDGQAALWWQSFDSMTFALASPEGQEASAALEVDEQAFTDTSTLSAFLAVEKTIFDYRDDKVSAVNRGAVKMLVEVWKRPDMSDEGFAERWEIEHGNLVREHAGAMGFNRYVQNHTDRSHPLNFAQARGWLQAPDGVTEVWWESEDHMRRSMASPEAAAASAVLAADEAQFIDGSRIRAYFSVEHCIFDHAPGRS